MRRSVAGLVALGLLALAIAGCGASKTSSKKLTFDYANLTDNSALFSSFQQSFVAGAKKLGITFNTYNNNESGTTALTNARLMVASHPNVIFDYNVVAGLGASLGSIFHKAGIRCVAVNIAAPPCPLENLNNPGMGQLAAGVAVPYMRSHGWTGANTTVLFLQNATAGASVNIAVRTFYSDVASRVTGMTPMPASDIHAATTTIGTTGIQVNAGGTLSSAHTAVADVLPGIASTRHLVLFGINDDLVLGGWSAIQDAGRSSQAIVIGLGGAVPAMQQLRTNPHWIGEDIPFLPGWAEIGLAMGVALSRGYHLPATTYIPQTILTKANVSHYYGSSNTTPKVLSALPPSDKYLIKTGVLQKFKNIPGV
jgi:ABC-type sugar transport system substrate-binding protein